MHKCLFRIVLGACNELDYGFACRCGKRRRVSRWAFWLA